MRLTDEAFCQPGLLVSRTYAASSSNQSVMASISKQALRQPGVRW